MDIKVLLNDGPPQVLGQRSSSISHRSSSISHSVTEPSPSTSAAKLATSSQSTPTPIRKKRGRHDPKPIWAVLEHERLPDEPRESREHTQSAPPAPTARITQPPLPTAYNGPPGPMGPPHVSTASLIGFERPFTGDVVVYDELSRKVCDFIWSKVIENRLVKDAIAEAPGTEVEIEARWGHILDHSGLRLTGIHGTECLVRQDMAAGYRFESTMTLEQHKKMNQFLNKHVQMSKDPNNSRVDIDYKHTREVDTLYELDQEGFDLLSASTKQLLGQTSSRQRVRVTRDIKEGHVIRKIVKCRIGNIEISSPLTEWDYRIGINLEIAFPGPIESLTPLTEHGRPSMERKKDRLSYSWQGAYQIDLTQVVQGQTKNHELELELNGAMVIEAAEAIGQGLPSPFEPLVTGMMNNLRVLSREMTTAKA